MKISFLGDIVCRSFDESHFSLNKSIFEDSDIIVGNLEGPILDKNSINCKKNIGIGLYSTKAVIEFLKFFDISTVFLGNNHINDFDTAVLSTTKKLKPFNIKFCGAGDSLHEAQKAVEYIIDNQKVLIYGFGWKNSGCKLASHSSDGVNPFEYNNLVKTVKDARLINQNAIIIFLLNWNYDMEAFPQPAYRRLSQELIRNGLDAVIGYHPHIVQGIELYEKKPIIYSVGNWYIPQGEYCSKNVSFPDICNNQVMIQLFFDKRKFKDLHLHWHKFSPKTNKITYENSESFYTSNRIKKLTPFGDLSNENYDVWFKKNRRIKKLIPVYYKMNSKWNIFKNVWHLTRQIIVNMLVNFKLKTQHTKS